MKFDDKLLPSENDLSQNEYKAAFCASHWISRSINKKKNIYAIVFDAYCEIGLRVILP